MKIMLETDTDTIRRAEVTDTTISSFSFRNDKNYNEILEKTPKVFEILEGALKKVKKILEEE